MIKSYFALLLFIFSINLFCQETGKFTDLRDGNEYNWVKIGDQTWMAENLRYFPEEDRLPFDSQKIQFYYVYGYDGIFQEEAKTTEPYSTIYSTFGVLYNWFAAMDGYQSSRLNPSGEQGICPDGWHLPSDAEWNQLIIFLGGEIKAGGKLKDTLFWVPPNSGATNESGFTALPGAYQDPNRRAAPPLHLAWYNLGYAGHWWSATEHYGHIKALHRTMRNEEEYVSRGYHRKEVGFSVRCVKDQ